MLLQGYKGKFFFCFVLFLMLNLFPIEQLHRLLPASLPVQILVGGLKFFLGKDEDEKNESDSESEASSTHKINTGVH